MKEFFSNLRNKINAFFYRVGQSKFMIKVKSVLGYIPEKIADNISFRTRKKIWGLVFILPLLIGFVYFFAIPFVRSVQFGFSNVYNDNGIKADWVGLSNYIYAFTEAATTAGSFTEILVQAVIDIVSDIPVILIFSLLVAVVLNSKFKGRAFVRAIFFMPVIFNSQAIDLAMTSATALQAAMEAVTNDLFSQMFSFEDFLLNANIPIGGVTFLSNASAKIYDIISYSGVQILIFLSAIQSVPKHLYEAAKIEGATQYEMFWKITFPMVSPMMLTAAVYTIVDSFLTSPLVNFISAYSMPDTIDTENLGVLTNYGVNAAMSWIFCLISIIIIGITLGVLSKAVFYYDE
ncbi:MAG: sugar ABC transporter permease [Bacilli bacterium]|jgi:ABC-type sugar transport system permease subunit|nr:sugar ABC transporter permease [Bacilli bacterium]